MHERDAVGLAGDEKAHARDVHQRHLVQVEHKARPESPDLGFELAQVSRLEAANEPEGRGLAVVAFSIFRVTPAAGRQTPSHV